MALTPEQYQQFKIGNMPNGESWMQDYLSTDSDTANDYTGAYNQYYANDLVRLGSPEIKPFDYRGQQMRAVHPGEGVFDPNAVIWDAERGQYITPPDNIPADQGFTKTDYMIMLAAAAGPWAIGAMNGAGAGTLAGAEGAAGAGTVATGAEMGAYGIGAGVESIPGFAALEPAAQAAFTTTYASGAGYTAAINAAAAAGAPAAALSAMQNAATNPATTSLVTKSLSALDKYGGLLSATVGAVAGGVGAKDGETTTTNGPPEWLQNALKQNLTNAYGVADASRYTPMNEYQTSALDGIANQAMAGSQANTAGQRQISDTLNGAYLNSNPYLDYNINKAQNDLVQQYQLGTAAQTDASAARANALGGSSYNQLTAYNNNNLANQLNNVDASMRGANYSNERNNQMSALGQVPGMVNTGYADMNNLYSAGNTLQQQNMMRDQWPEHQLGIQQSALQTSIGGAGSVQSTPYESNRTAGLLGGAMTGLSLWNQYNK